MDHEMFGDYDLCQGDWGCYACRKLRADFLAWLRARAAAEVWEIEEPLLYTGRSDIAYEV